MIQSVPLEIGITTAVVVVHIDTHYLYLFPRDIAVFEIRGVCAYVCVSAGSSPSACHLSDLVVVHCNDITPFWKQTAVPWGGPRGHDLSHCFSTLPRAPEEQPSRGHPVRSAWELERIPENEGFPSGAPLPLLTGFLWPDHSSVCPPRLNTLVEFVVTVSMTLRMI